MGMNAHTKGNDAMASLAVSKTAHGGSNPSSPVPRAANYRVCGFEF